MVSSKVRKLSPHSVTRSSSSSGVPNGSHAVSELSMASIFSLASATHSNKVWIEVTAKNTIHLTGNYY
jgi:hypothetical protein